MDKNEIVAQRIREIRKEQNLSAEYVAAQLGITKGAYSNMENGKVEITITRLYALSSIFNKPLSDILRDTGIVNQVSHGEYAQNQYQHINCHNFYNGNFAEIERLHNDSIENIRKANDLMKIESMRK